MVRYYEIIKENEPGEDPTDYSPEYWEEQERLNHFQEIQETLEKNFRVDDYQINDDETITAATCFLKNNFMKKIPVKFRYVKSLYLSYALKIISLEGCPEYCGHFELSFSKLKSLKDGPKKVNSMKLTDNYDLESLDDMPTVSGIFEIIRSPLLNFGWNVPQKYLDKVKTYFIEYDENLPILRTLDTEYKDSKIQVKFDVKNNKDDLIVSRIILHHIETYSDINERIYMCREELKEKGYRRNAKW
jgi:hypothetical protein